MNHSMMNEQKLMSIRDMPEVSPIERKMQDLRDALGCAHEGMELLAQKLMPVRSVGPTTGSAGIAQNVDASCEFEQRLQSMIESASSLSRKLSELRGELRI